MGMKSYRYPNVEMPLTSIWGGGVSKMGENALKRVSWNNTYLVFLISLPVLHCSKEPFTHTGNEALVGTKPDHGVALPGAGLAVGQEGGVVALPGAVQDAMAQVTENFSLGRRSQASGSAPAVHRTPKPPTYPGFDEFHLN